jgi:hypothetical protein
MSTPDLTPETTVAAVVAAERPALVALAYRLLGSAAEAEDVVQEACLKLEQHGLTGIDRPGAWLNRVTSRLCLDRLRSVQARRESYVGPWLPEPLPTDGTDDPAREAELVPANGGAGVLARTAAGVPIVLFVLGLTWSPGTCTIPPGPRRPLKNGSTYQIGGNPTAASRVDVAGVGDHAVVEHPLALVGDGLERLLADLVGGELLGGPSSTVTCSRICGNTSPPLAQS